MFLVTGGCGFIGAHLVAALVASGASVRVVDDLSAGDASRLPAGVELLVGDVADPAVAAEAMRGIGGCFHLAAMASTQAGREDWPGAHRVNQSATVAVLDAARNGRTPVVFASSAAVYGEGGGAVLREDHAAAPLSPYGADKLCSEIQLAAATRAFAVPTLALRFFNVYGPGQRADSAYAAVISSFCRSVLAGQSLTIDGDGLQTRDFVHVDDVVTALRAGMAALRAGRHAGAVFNVCTGKGCTIRDLAGRIATVHGVAADLRHGPARPVDIRHSVGDPGWAERALGWVARVSLEQGLARQVPRARLSRRAV